MRGTWQTTSGSSGPTVLVVLVVIGLAIAAGSGAAAQAVHAAAELLHIVLIAVAVLAGVAVAGLAGLIVWQVRAHRQLHGALVHPAPPQRVPLPGQRQAVPAPQIHLHLHGPVSAADVAELIARQGLEAPDRRSGGAPGRTG